MSAPVRPDDVLERAIREPRDVPSVPPFDRVLARIAGHVGAPAEAPGGRRPFLVGLRRSPRALWGAACAAAACVVAALVLSRPADDRAGWRLASPAADAVRVLRDGRAADPGRLLPGDVVEARDAARVRVGDRLAVEMEPGASVARVGEDRLLLRSGRATFDLGPGTATAPSRFGTGRVDVVDRGTRFTLDVADDAGAERLLVAVESGRVEANGVVLASGHGLAFRDGAPAGAPWPLDGRPTVTLEVDGPPARAGAPVTLRFVLSNPTDGWIPVPATDGLKAPLMLEVTDPSGTAASVRVTRAMLVPAAPAATGTGTAIPPRGRVVVGVRFEHTFASPGTYRLRAVYRPAGSVESPTSPAIALDVR